MPVKKGGRPRTPDRKKATVELSFRVSPEVEAALDKLGPKLSTIEVTRGAVLRKVLEDRLKAEGLLP